MFTMVSVDDGDGRRWAHDDEEMASTFGGVGEAMWSTSSRGSSSGAGVVEGWRSATGHQGPESAPRAERRARAAGIDGGGGGTTWGVRWQQGEGKLGTRHRGSPYIGMVP